MVILCPGSVYTVDLVRADTLAKARERRRQGDVIEASSRLLLAVNGVLLGGGVGGGGVGTVEGLGQEGGAWRE
jgi:hypothetical protein